MRNRAVLVPLLWLGLLGACSDEAPSPSASGLADAKSVVERPAVEPAAAAPPGRPAEDATAKGVPLPTIPHPPMPARPGPVEERSPEELIEAGRAVYNANCIACHNLDPTQDGALGPAVAGSPLPLIEARVMRAEYPEGYTPKRPTRVMVPLPHLEPKLPELAAYLASLESSS
ncbi:MAG TPA: cytochrome c [Deltaproteobacteria bacterium]|nr:cytochrome c [Deltaproteobacteria bacterium]